MTDVYKGRTKDLVQKALKEGKNIILETVFNDRSFAGLVDDARNSGYYTSLVVLFLDTLQHSIERVASRSVEQNGLTISGNNIRINFNESFKNISSYYFYFDQADFIYTGITGRNQPIMSFTKSELTEYHSSELQYPQKFIDFAHSKQRLSDEAYHLIRQNEDYRKGAAGREGGHFGLNY
jgi:predicted ABC-type ATPase